MVFPFRCLKVWNGTYDFARLLQFGNSELFDIAGIGVLSLFVDAQGEGRYWPASPESGLFAGHRCCFDQLSHCWPGLATEEMRRAFIAQVPSSGSTILPQIQYGGRVGKSIE